MLFIKKDFIMAKKFSQTIKLKRRVVTYPIQTNVTLDEFNENPINVTDKEIEEEAPKKKGGKKAKAVEAEEKITEVNN